MISQIYVMDLNALRFRQARQGVGNTFHIIDVLINRTTNYKINRFNLIRDLLIPNNRLQ